MDSWTWISVAFEIGFIAFLLMLYYFYQKRKIIRFEKNKIPFIMEYLIQSCLAEKLDKSQPKLDHLIEALDDFLKDNSTNPPIELLKTFAQAPECSPDLKEIILESLKELEQ